MSENFDKEAERQRLREKYESDSADREATERMSQLLLQGATMTNKHCDTCGSPIFRYQGQAFCPTCQVEAAGTADAETAAQPAGEAETGAQPAESRAGATPKTETPAETPAAESVGAASTGTAELGALTDSQQAQGPANAGEQSGQAGTPQAVRTSLAETIVTLSDRARQSEDPNQARALLEAAREAAETLSTLQGR